MNHKTISISISLLCLLYFSFALSAYGDYRSSESKNELVVYYKSTTFEIDPKSIDNILEELNPSKSYRIQGYACSNGKKTEEQFLAEAERRAGIVRDLLIQKGFSKEHLTTTAYAYSSECKVILIAME